MHLMFFSQKRLLLDHLVPVGTTVDGWYYAYSWGKKCGLNYQNCWCVVSFRSRKMRTLITIVMCKIWCNNGAGRCWHILHTLQILPPCDYCLFAHVKEHLWGKLFELEDYVNTAVNASLHCLSKHDYRTMDCLLCRQEKCVDSACDYIQDTCVNIQDYE